MEDATRYFSIARTVSRDNSGFGVPDNQFAIGLGCEISHAQRLVYSRGINLDMEAATRRSQIAACANAMTATSGRRLVNRNA